jgi:coenzyme F420-reducing hydrogenase beta subunit
MPFACSFSHRVWALTGWLFLLKALFAQPTHLSNKELNQVLSSHAEKVQAYRAQEEEIMEKQFLKGSRDEDLGVYSDIFSAKSDVLGQNGGVVTALLQKGLREGLFDVAVVARRMEGYRAEAIVAENSETAMASKGTVYVKVNVSKKLRELISMGKKRIAVVCTPCEVKSVRKIQQSIGKDAEVTVIGLFCFEAFNPIKLKEELSKQGIDLEKTEKTEVSKGKFTATVNGKAVSCKVKDLDGAVEPACRFCSDFTSKLADVSVGSVGSKQGYSTVIVRSPAGERLVKDNGFVKDTVDKQDIAKLARFKRERSEKCFAALNPQA